MKQKLLIILAFLMTWGTGGAWGQTTEQYNAALANITAGTYRIYAVDGSGNKYYLKVSKTNYNNNKTECDFAITSTSFAEASTFTISQSTDGSSKEKATGWMILSEDYVFTNPFGGSESGTDFTGGTCLRGYKSGSRTNAYDRQVLYYNGTGYAVHACNTTSGNWGGAAYWGLDGSKNVCYVAAASKEYIWHFERVVETGYYRIYGNAYNNQSLSYLLSNLDGTALANSYGPSTNDSKVEQTYSGADNRDVWYISAGSAAGTYSIKNVSNNKYIQITAGNGSNGSNALSGSPQDVCFTDYYQYIGANSTLSHRFINLNKNTIYVYKGPDANNQFTLYPMTANALTITGLTNQSVAIANNNHKSAATNGGTVYIDSRASAAGDLTVTTNYEDLTANVSSFSAGAVSVAVGYNRTFATAEQSYTVCLPFALSSAEVAAINGKFYELTSYAANTLNFEEVSSTTAYTPYLFKPSVANVNISSSSYALVDYGAQSLTTTVSENAASFIGTVAEATLKSNATYTLYGYRASDGVFVQIGTGDGAHIDPCRAYIQIPGASPVKAFNVQLNDLETGLKAIDNGQLTIDNAGTVFNLAGQRVEGGHRQAKSLQRGVYIVNGKKVVVK